MTKIAVVWASPNKNGTTASAKNQIIRGFTDAGGEVVEFHLNEKHLEHCRACGDGWGICREQGKCVINDDFAEIYQALAEADGIVWISAVYWQETTECFKAFFDRLRRCDAFTGKKLREKRCMLIACAGGTGKGTIETLTQMERGLTHMGMKVFDRIPVVRFNKEYMLPAIYEAGKTYADKLENGFDLFY